MEFLDGNVVRFKTILINETGKIQVPADYWLMET